jgi:hypothetical protein
MEDRDEKGHFIKGHKSLGGRPKGTKKAQLLIRWDKLCKGKHTDRVYYALLDAALSGDVAAIRLYLQYALGSQKEEMEINQFILGLKLGTALMADLQVILNKINKLKAIIPSS